MSFCIQNINKEIENLSVYIFGSEGMIKVIIGELARPRMFGA